MISSLRAYNARQRRKLPCAHPPASDPRLRVVASGHVARIYSRYTESFLLLALLHTTRFLRQKFNGRTHLCSAPCLSSNNALRLRPPACYCLPKPPFKRIVYLRTLLPFHHPTLCASQRTAACLRTITRWISKTATTKQQSADCKAYIIVTKARETGELNYQQKASR